MRRSFPVLGTTILSLGLAAGPVAAQDTLDRIEMPDGWAPEGITTDGERLFAGSLANGAVLAADPVTGETAIINEGAEGWITAGIDYDEAGRLWAAGAGTGEVRAHDADTGEVLATYPFEAGFLNDVAVTPEAVYITDSFVPQVLVVPMADGGGVVAPEEAFALPISGDLVYGDGFNVNGIVATDAGLVVVHSGTGELFRIDPASGQATRIDTSGVDLTAGDGMELDGDTLYVVRNQANRVVVLELADDATSATALDELTSDDLAVPTTAALVGDDLWAVNARFDTDATPDTPYWITRLAAGDDMDA